MTKLPEYDLEKINNFLAKQKLDEKQKAKFIKECELFYENNLIPNYEPVGIVAAQSLCEPATQMTLRTKHYAGALEVSVGSGIKRLEELIDARTKTKNPVMTIFIRDDFKKDDKALKKYLNSLIYKKLSDLVTIKEDIENEKIEVNYITKVLEEYDLTVEDLQKQLKSALKLSSIKEIKNGFEILFKGQTPLTIRKYFMKLLDLGFVGIYGINDAIISNEDDEIVIKTQGSNLKEVFNLDFVDVYRSYTNDIFEIHKMFGIEAARKLLFKEIAQVYASFGVDLRHILLLVDSMCYDGEVLGVVRSGIVNTKKSPLARAAFEQTEKVLFNASLYGEHDEFEGVVENVMAGLPINVGAGKVELAVDFDKIPKENKEIKKK